MNTTKDTKRREQADRQRKVKRTLDMLINTVRLELNFVTEADTCIKHMESVFIYFCQDSNDSNTCSNVQVQFKTLLNKIVDARSTIQYLYDQLCEVVQSSREIPNVLNSREEIGDATDVVLDGLLVKAQKATNVVTEHVKHVQTTLMEATELTKQVLQSYERNANIPLKEGS